MKVDIIVVTYKRYDLLQEALKSVANQSYPHWKCWIAEDGESKETYEAVKPFLRDNRFAYLPGTHAGYPLFPEIAPFGKELLPILRHWMMVISGCLRSWKIKLLFWKAIRAIVNSCV